MNSSVLWYAVNYVITVAQLKRTAGRCLSIRYTVAAAVHDGIYFLGRDHRVTRFSIEH